MNDYTIAKAGQETGVEKVAYNSLDTTTAEGKRALYNATNHPDYSISDFINKEIEVANIYVDVNERIVKDEDGNPTGEIEAKPRTVLIDSNGKSYIAGVSIGVFKAVREIIRIFGEPSEWDAPITVVVRQVNTSRGNMLTLDIK